MAMLLVGAVMGADVFDTPSGRPASLVGGQVDGTKCEVEAVQRANSAQLHSILEELANTTYFRLVRVAMDEDCAFTWGDANKDEVMCGSTPPGGAGAAFGFDTSLSPAASGGPSLCSIEPSGNEVNPFISESESNVIEDEFEDDLDDLDDDESIKPDFWFDICRPPRASDKLDYVNLLLNPEHNTGYNGSHIWEAIDAENCVSIGRGLGTDGYCYEERVLQRLLSGMHEAVTIQVLANYYPPKKGEVAWKPNNEKFMATVGKHPEWLKNLNFAYLVTLRALHKAKPVLYNWEYSTGEPVDDENTQMLMKHLLDASEMKLCTPVFQGFDEDSLFPVDRADRRQLAEQFKSVFQNITALTNCVRCRRCRLHSKVTLLGLGTALKVLLTPDVSLLPSALSRDEVVALVNTVHKFSHGLMEVGRLTNLYLEDQRKLVTRVSRPAAAFSNSGASVMELALSHVAELHLNQRDEDLLVDAIVDEDKAVLSLAATFPAEAFCRHALRYIRSKVTTGKTTSRKYDVVVVGGGLAGMSAAIASADRGARVLLLDKSKHLGGNSAKASSGINVRMDTTEECYEAFLNDTLQSCESGLGPCGHPDLANVLVNDSLDTVKWVQERFGVPLSTPVRLGGHSRARTVRPQGGIIGAELTAAGSKVAHSLSNIVVVNSAQLTGLIVDRRVVRGVTYTVGINEEEVESLGDSVVLATGGFGFDVSADSLMAQYRPDLLDFPTTLGPHTTGDGIKIAVRDAGVGLRDMEQVQLHPTGFIDPKHPDARTKVLAAEILRGVGGVLLDQHGQRFCDELGTRKYVTAKMLERAAETGGSARAFSLLIPYDAVHGPAERHITMYKSRGLLREVDFRGAVKFVGGDSWKDSVQAPSNGRHYFVGKVTPVIHYTMGGISIDTNGHVLDTNGAVINGLWAAGEVSGGVHGRNRLGGNSLLECAVFGKRIGDRVPIEGEPFTTTNPRPQQLDGRQASLGTITSLELAEHGSPSDCWISLYGLVYDFSDYSSEHPGGPPAIEDSCGRDATETFRQVHTASLVQDMGFEPIGKLEEHSAESSGKHSGRADDEL